MIQIILQNIKEILLMLQMDYTFIALIIICMIIKMLRNVIGGIKYV